MTERVGRWIYALEALAIGLPTLAFATPKIALGLFVGTIDVISGASGGWKILGMALGGGFGLAAWWVLSGHYLSGGRRGLGEVGDGWWWALLAGVVAAICWLLAVNTHGLARIRLDWLAGPLLIIPALHLSYLRLRSPR